MAKVTPALRPVVTPGARSYNSYSMCGYWKDPTADAVDGDGPNFKRELRRLPWHRLAVPHLEGHGEDPRRSSCKAGVS